MGNAQAGLGYTGEWQDTNVGLTYLRARWYDGAVGRFTQVDPWEGNWWQPQSLNKYAYVVNNPIKLVDPSGYIPRLRPPDVCPFPSENAIIPKSMFLRHEFLVRTSDGTIVNHPISFLSPGQSIWWNCGDFGITAYQFVSEADDNGNSWYADTGGTDITVNTLDGANFTANSLFIEDLRTNGTGKPMATVCQEQGNYVMNPDGNFYCGKGRPFVAGSDDYQGVAAGDALRMGAEIYVPGLENTSSPMGNADFKVRDTGGALNRYHIDVFVGEGPGILSERYDDSPTSRYTSFQHWQNEVPIFYDLNLVNNRQIEKLGPLPLFQKSSVTWWPINICSTF